MITPPKAKISDLNVLLCGLAFTSRTETVEDFLKGKARSLTVIAISSCFLKENLSSCRVYEKGVIKSEFKIPNLRLRNYKWYMQPLMPWVVLTYFMSISICMLKLRKKYDIYIGVSHTFGLWGVVLKKLKIVKKVIYYCIDYYIPDPKLNFHTLFVKLLTIIDRITVRSADHVWDLSPYIPEFRHKIGNVAIGSYKGSIVPLGYSGHVRRFKTFNEINRWEIGFVGSITSNQGLQLLVEALPLVLPNFPHIRVTVIGEGPYSGELKDLVSKGNLNSRFHFCGFIKDENTMLDILSGCAVAVALYSTEGNQNIRCADTGKPKLYALCGLPIITTTFYTLHEDIKINHAGVVVDYNKEELKNAIAYLMGNDERLKEFKMNSFNLGNRFISDNVFHDAFTKLELD